MGKKKSDKACVSGKCDRRVHRTLSIQYGGSWEAPTTVWGIVGNSWSRVEDHGRLSSQCGIMRNSCSGAGALVRLGVGMGVDIWAESRRLSGRARGGSAQEDPRAVCAKVWRPGLSIGPENRLTAISVCVYVPSTQWEIDEAPVSSWGSCQSNVAQNCIVQFEMISFMKS